MPLLSKKTTLCTGVRNRLAHLLKVFPTWLMYPVDEILVVDWSSDEEVANHLAGFNDGRLKIIRVKGEPDFKPSVVWNFVIRNAQFDNVLKVDSDIYIEQDLFKNARVTDTFQTGHYLITGKGTFGTVFLSKEMFYSVNGYNERLVGWGYEDNDFYNRLKQQGYTHQYFKKGCIKHLDHSDDIRLMERLDQNKSIARTKIWTHDDVFYSPAVAYVEKSL